MILPETRFYFRTTYHFKELLIYFNIYIKYLKSFLNILMILNVKFIQLTEYQLVFFNKIL
jgi:hypothetical protein